MQENDSPLLLQEISRYIYEQSGIYFSDLNMVLLKSKLKERLKILNNETIAAYLDRLQTDNEELIDFLDAITTNLTSFFRNTGHYKTFVQYVIPKLIEQKPLSHSYHVRLWSAGCSTGEESYTSAMVLQEHLPAHWTFDVIASDLSLKSLEIAQNGFYPESKLKKVPENYREKYFVHHDEGCAVKDFIKKKVTFDYHNLNFESGYRNFDVVFCRNVLIYFDNNSQRNLINHIWKTMSDLSYLFIGHSESLFGMDTSFEYIETDNGCLYKKIVPEEN